MLVDIMTNKTKYTTNCDDNNNNNNINDDSDSDNNNDNSNNNNNNDNNNNFIYIAFNNVKKEKKWNNLHITNIKNLFTIHIQHVLKSFHKNNDPLSKNYIKRYVFNPLLKPVKGGDSRKSNGSEFHVKCRWQLY